MRFLSAITPDYSFSISCDSIQNEISKKFPLTHEKIKTKITVHDPLLIIRKGSDKITIRAKVTANVPLLGGRNGYIGINSSIDFNKETRKIYVKDPTIDTIVIDGLPEKFLPTIRIFSDFLLTKFLNNYPVYTLKDDWKNRLVKDIKIDDEKISVTIGV